MNALLQLPPELKAQIWASVCADKDNRPTVGAFGSVSPTRSLKSSRAIPRSAILRTCRRFCNELTPHLYHRILLKLSHSDDVLAWIATIGPRNSSCIRHLALQFTSLPSAQDRAVLVPAVPAREEAWTAFLRCLPSLFNLTFNSINHGRTRSVDAPHLDEILNHEAFICNTLASSAKAWSERLLLVPYKPSKAGWSQEEDSLSSREISHGFFAIDEPLPPVLVLAIRSLSGTPTTPPRSTTLDTDITNLPASFFANNGFHLSRVTSFHEKSDHLSATHTYIRSTPSLPSPVTCLKTILTDLPSLKYLRIGCRDLDSSFLPHLPPNLTTLDVAFTETDPNRLAENLKLMLHRCRKLFTVAIAVSPLHDRDPRDEAKERFFNRREVKPELRAVWMPFWDVLDEMQKNGLKSWEGEGPGFKRVTNRK